MAKKIKDLKELEKEYCETFNTNESPILDLVILDRSKEGYNWDNPDQKISKSFYRYWAITYQFLFDWEQGKGLAGQLKKEDWDFFEALAATRG